MKTELSKEQPKELGDYKVEYYSTCSCTILWGGEIVGLWEKVKYWYKK